MPTWDSAQYLKFGAERTRPAVDLAARVRIEAPRRVIDLGCGPGNSTTVVAARWPGAELFGLDNSPAMIAAAQKAYPLRTWVTADIASWTAERPVDVIFTNAALQWVPDHDTLLPRLFAQLAPGGALAVQIPGNYDGDAHRLMREVAASATWHRRFEEPVREWQVHSPGFYYDTLTPKAALLDLWTTEYIHVLDGPEGIVEWYRGTGLRPFLERLRELQDQEHFLQDYLAEVARVFPRQSDGKVLFPFRRLFFVAYQRG